MTTHEKALKAAADAVWNGHLYDIDAFVYGQKFITPNDETAASIAQSAIAAYISALLPEDAAALVEELLTLKAGFAADGDNFGMEVSEALHNAASLIQSQAARIAGLEAGLRPVAQRCDEAVRPDDSDNDGVTVKTKHLRAARSLLTKDRQP